MPIARRFLGWDRPALPEAARWLLAERAAAGAAPHDAFDLSGTIVALPSSRARRRLLELLVEAAESAGAVLIPPRTVTVGALPELLYDARRPFADDLVQRLAWMRALHQVPPAILRRVVPHPPAESDLDEWLALAALFARLHRELAADGLDAHDVVRLAADLPGFRDAPRDAARNDDDRRDDEDLRGDRRARDASDPRPDEAARWEALAEIQQAYLRVLDAQGLWDLQTARLFALRHPGECRTDRDLVLVGTVDLNRAQRGLLDLVARRVTTLVFAPPELADRFDEHGCLRPERWGDDLPDIPRDRVRVVDGPGDQADETLRLLATLDGRASADEITLGVPDERLVPWLQQRFEEARLPLRYGPGTPLDRAEPCRFLDAAADFCKTNGAEAFASLARLPCVERLLLAHGIDGRWLAELDAFRGRHLPAALAPDAWPEGTGAPLRRAAHVVFGLLAPLAAAPSRRTPRDWGEPVALVLQHLYAGRTWDRNRPGEHETVAALESLRTALEGLDRVPDTLTPRFAADEILALVLESVAGETVAPPADEASVEVVGWLDLPWDDAPVTVATGFDDAFVPATRSADAFLPVALRRRLGLEDDARRTARDRYACCLLCGAWRTTWFVAGRRGPDGEPLFPSRFLFSGDDRERAERARLWFAPPVATGPRLLLPGRPRARVATSLLPIPELPTSLAEVTALRVTEFRDFLACPYRYALRHRLKLRALDDRAEELDGGAFGSLLHEVLAEFAQRHDLSSVADPAPLREFLSGELDAQVARRFGRDVLPAARIQVEMLRRRLAAFATWQADWTGRGWRIAHAELEVSGDQALFVVDERAVSLHGRIDRVDVHEKTGEVVVLDYKSGDKAQEPDKTHREKSGAWIDLQLPLYRHLLAAAVPDLADRETRLGYVVVPKSDQVRDALAEWTADDLREADETARHVVRGIRAGRTARPVVPPPPFFDEFSAICQDDRIPADDDEFDADAAGGGNPS